MSRSKRKPYYYIECIKPKTVKDLKNLGKTNGNNSSKKIN